MKAEQRYDQAVRTLILMLSMDATGCVFHRSELDSDPGGYLELDRRLCSSSELTSMNICIRNKTRFHVQPDRC